ncbi:MAG TPA: photosystem reaction center subunit H [Thermoplasmatales archaeon]|nr:photosystem reaction center subunit H [Thermoplasmatales archaeon]
MENVVTSLVRLPVYTRDGIYVGNVKNVLLDIEQKRVASLLITKTNPNLVEGAVDVAVPYRWVNAVGDIVILSYFPKRVRLETESENLSSEEKIENAEIEMIEDTLLEE